MATNDFIVKEHVAPHVEGETPDWYDPNGSFEYVNLTLLENSGGSPLPVTVTLSLQELSSLEIAGKPAEERLRIIKQYALSKLLSGDNGGMPKKELPMENQLQVIDAEVPTGNNAGACRCVNNSTSENLLNKVSPPTVEVVVKPGGTPLNITTYYHDVISLDGSIVLVYDLRHIGYQRLSFDAGSVFVVSVPSRGISNLKVLATNFNFVHNQFEYTVLSTVIEKYEVDQ